MGLVEGEQADDRRPYTFRAAKLLIAQRGEDAPLRAVQRADELLVEGDMEGSTV